MIQLNCPVCGIRLELEGAPYGSPVQCPGCAAVFHPFRAPAPAPPPKKKKRRRRDDDSQWLIDDAPPDPLLKRQRRAAGRGVTGVLIPLLLLLVLNQAKIPD